MAMAVDLANQFDAKLLGVGAELNRAPTGGDSLYAGVGYGAVFAAAVAHVEVNLNLAHEKFRAAGAAVRRGTDWRAAVGLPVVELASEARAADLVVTSLGSRHGRSDYNTAAPGALVMHTGRPVLAVPHDISRLNPHKILVGWKDTREARRAIHDALPFLKRAATVLLTEIVESREMAPSAESRLADVAAHLLQHGAKTHTSVAVEEKGSNAAHQLLEMAAQQKADLVVAGGYGHSRLQEWVFGGFTRELLAQSERAVMLSH